MVRGSVDEQPILESAVDEGLLAEMVRRFPGVIPSESDTHEEICRKQGEQRVIRLLISAYYQQNPEVK